MNQKDEQAQGSEFSGGFGALSRASQDVVAERQRQIKVEGWTDKHDDQHEDGGLAFAAACYALHAGAEAAIAANAASPVGNDYLRSIQALIPRMWPWNARWWKPSDRRRNLIKAGALILAEIERLDRRG